MKKLSIVVPCFNEKECIKLLWESVEQVFQKVDSFIYEIIYVDDGSRDGTLQEIKSLAKVIGDEKIKYISFSRNFGKEAAMYAGLLKADGNYVVLMDADLQHPPELLPKMLEILEDGNYDCCGARRVNRKGVLSYVC